MFYDKGLYKKAGLDPAKPPATLQEFADHARKIAKLGGQSKGTYFGGNCGGCVEFTFWPSVWADGADMMNDDGTESTINSPEMAAVFKIYRELYADGTASAGSKDENGSTWLGALQSGNVGIAPGPSSWLSLIKEKGIDVGVAPIPGVKGNQSTFVGGDVAGIAATSKHPKQAWDFLSWTLGDEAQVEVVAKQGQIIARTDLAENKYAVKDPNVVAINSVLGKGRTPYALNFNATYNDPQSPWTTCLRGALFGRRIQGTGRRTERDHQVAPERVGPSPAYLAGRRFPMPAPASREPSPCPAPPLLRRNHVPPGDPHRRAGVGAAADRAAPASSARRATRARSGLRVTDRGRRRGVLRRPAAAGRLDVAQPLAAARAADVQRAGQLRQHRGQHPRRRRDLVHPQVHAGRHGHPVRRVVRPGAAGAEQAARRRLPAHRVLPARRRRLRHGLVAVPRHAQQRDRADQPAADQAGHSSSSRSPGSAAAPTRRWPPRWRWSPGGSPASTC